MHNKYYCRFGSLEHFVTIFCDHTVLLSFFLFFTRPARKILLFAAGSIALVTPVILNLFFFDDTLSLHTQFLHLLNSSFFALLAQTRALKIFCHQRLLLQNSVMTALATSLFLLASLVPPMVLAAAFPYDAINLAFRSFSFSFLALSTSMALNRNQTVIVPRPGLNVGAIFLAVRRIPLPTCPTPYFKQLMLMHSRKPRVPSLCCLLPSTRC